MANRLKKMVIREISAVDFPASPGADIILMKGGSGEILVGFDPILSTIGKAARNDSDDDSEDDDDAAADGDDDDDDEEIDDDDDRGPGFPTRSDERKATHAMVKRLLNKRYGGPSHEHVGDNQDGADARSADERAADAQRVSDQCNSHPPVASETSDQWLHRIFGNDLPGLDGAEITIARRLYKALMNRVAVAKSAGDAFAEIAKRRHAADPSRGFYAHWADVVKENPGLYTTMRKSEADPSHMDSHFTTQEAIDYYSGKPDSPGAWGVRSDGSDGGGSSMDFLNTEADAIRKRSNGKLTKAQSFTKACAENPEAYEKMRRETR
jgi:hypothetical protein